MTFQQEAASWLFPGHVSTSPVPEIGSNGPTTDKLPIPDPDGKPMIVTFLRHCGCPFAEKTFISLRNLASANSSIHCVAVSHSDASATNKWIESVGGAGSVEVIVDFERELYGKFGLGVSNTWHVLNPWSLWEVYKLGKSEGIWNRPTETGSRWQTAGSFAVDGKGVMRWVSVAGSADAIPDFDQGVKNLDDK